MQGVPYGALGTGVPYVLGNLFVADSLSVGNLANAFPDRLLELGPVQLYGDGELAAFTGEVLRKLADGLGVHLCGAATDLGLALGTGVGACLHAARERLLARFAVEREPAQLGSLEYEGPFAPHVPVVHDGKA